MFEATYVGATGMQAHAHHVDVISHNMANVNTVGFRRQLVNFDELTAALTPAGTTAGVPPTEPTRGAGAIARTTLSLRPGELRPTGEPLDIAIAGAGYLELVRLDGSPAYTRAGSLAVSAEGFLTAADGTPLASRIEIPPDVTAIRILTDGRVLATVSDQAEEVELGRLELVRFANPAGLEAIGESQFLTTADSGEGRTGLPGEDGFGTILQGQLESSNVQLVDELVSLLLAQRAFEMNSRVVQASDQLMAITNGLFRA